MRCCVAENVVAKNKKRNISVQTFVDRGCRLMIGRERPDCRHMFDVSIFLRKKERNMKKLFAILLTAAMAFSLAACGAAATSEKTQTTPEKKAESASETAEQGTSEGKEKITVRISNFAGTAVPYNVGIDTGIFDEVLADSGYDVEFEITNFPSGAAAVEAAQAGELDIITSGDQMLTTAILANGLPFKVICANYTNSKWSYIVSSKSGIQKPEDLRGSTVGVTIGTNIYIAVLAYLEKNGISTEDVEVANLSSADQLTAFQSGEIDWFLANVKAKDKALEIDPDAVILDTNKEYKMNECVIGVSDEFAAAHHDLVVLLVKAFHEATEYALANQEEAIEIALNHYDTDREAQDYNWQDTDYVTKIDASLQESIQKTLDFSYSSGLIPQSATVEDVVDFTYLEEAGIQ